MAGSPRIEFRHPVVPVLSRLTHSPALPDDSYRRRQCHYFERDDAGFRRKYRPYRYTVHGTVCLGRFHLLRPSTLYRQRPTDGQAKVKLVLNAPLSADTTYMWLRVTLRDSIDLTHRISLEMRPHRHWQRHPCVSAVTHLLYCAQG